MVVVEGWKGRRAGENEDRLAMGLICILTGVKLHIREDGAVAYERC